MVHALSEIHRTLVPDGILIDLRPMSEERRVEVFSARKTQEMGYATLLSRELDDNAAANQAMTTVESKGWFTREREENFPIHYVWDSPKEMEEWIDDEWEDFIELDEDLKQATRSAWALGDGDTHVRLRIKMLITRWIKLNKKI
ncbi:MAG TPA: hypothetical protein VK851_08475 [Anaerolineales bacterium]|nr:hypothetical protein [Anaerolineales bacterium]